MKKYDIFISYRRSGGEYTAKILKDRLEDMGYRVFFDVESLRSGDFNTKLYSVIEESTDFLLILSPDSMERCNNENDWLRLEIVHALSRGINIIPIMLRGFSFPEALPQEIEPLRLKNGIEANSEFFDAFIGRLTKDFLKAKPRIHNRVTQNIIFRRTWPVLLSLTILAGVAVGGFTLYNANNKIYPKSSAEKNLTDEVEKYLQSDLISADNMTGRMSSAFRACDNYLVHNDAETYQDATAAIDGAYADISGISVSRNAADADLLKTLDNSPFSKANLESVNDILSANRQSMLNTLQFLKSLLDPKTSIDVSVKRRYVELDQKTVDLFAETMVYSVNDLLLPVSDGYLKDFKQNTLTSLTNLPFGSYTWQTSEDELERMDKTDTNQLQAVVNEMSSLIGDDNYKLMQEKAELINYEISKGISSEQAEADVAKSFNAADSLTAMEKKLDQLNQQLADEKAKARQKFAPLDTDSSSLLWGKMLRFLTLSMYDDALKCAQAYQLKVNATDPNAAVYMPVVIQFIQSFVQTGINYGMIVMDYEPGKPHNSLYKVGDIIVGLNGQPCRTCADYNKLIKKGVSNTVSIMRRNEQGKLVVGNYQLQSGQNRVLLGDLTETD